MKLYYFKILLFSLLLNILAHNKNKSYIAPHIPTTTTRVLSECNVYIPNYDNDPDMNSVRENFHKKTEQRFHEYDKRMIKNRQKRKEERDKNIQEIIEKDRMDKSLAEKVEKGCLKCGCGLGGVAASIGIFGTIAVNEWTKAATAAAIDLAIQEGIDAGVKVVIAEIKATNAFKSIWYVELSSFINGSNYNTVDGLSAATKAALDSIGKRCTSSIVDRACNGILNNSDGWFSSIAEAGKQAATAATESAKTTKLVDVTTTSTHLYSAIGYSVLAIFIILLVMVIIYLILRYRRKKK
ncbi:rifin [Plasmodium falciparum NF54]|uniref:Rifin n=2 Tax=Plasmodium falciparum TaxID=5833 RepID=Q8IJ01_PLAF7|nr:rifin [Plasmodium falciparum 3D7]KAF4330842.1 rifin [Plasmodium falciparum NF54]PKC43413.1 rifin [Plasmodium falciparum NF54]CZT98663.1 rifin [Plasmodium falciparum 3D7]|eukprot:XP_001347685.1 rifin [Plasmodium falciparum 3D7]